MIDQRKLVDYALNPSHDHGRHKAAVFEAALGIGRQDAHWLAAQLLSALPTAPVSHVRAASGARPDQAVVPIVVTGRNGRRLTVVTVWKTMAGYPELVTLRVQRRKRGRRP